MNNYELMGRFSSQTPEKSIRTYAPQAEQYSFGLTRYVWEHSLKLQTEVTRNREMLTGGDELNSWYLRFQIEIGI